MVITGPTGWIGQALLAHLAARCAEGFAGKLASRVTLFGSAERDLVLACGETVPVRALGSICPEDVAGAHVVHLAYLTKEKADLLGERAFFDMNLAIDDAVLGALGSAAPASVFVASSGAAKLAAEGIDLHPYGVAKLRQEARFLAWGKAAAVPVIAGRIFNIAGPYINKLESYAVANFALQGLRAGRIAITAQVPVFRSFIHVDDLCALVVDSALHGIGRDRPIDLCGAEVLEMADIAERVGSLLGGNIAIERGAVDVARASAYLGDFPDTKSLAMQTGRSLKSATECLQDTVAWVRELADPL